MMVMAMKQPSTCHTYSMPKIREILESTGMMVITMKQPTTCYISSMSRTRKDLMGMITMTLAWSTMAPRNPEHMFNNLLKNQSMMMEQSTTCHISSMSRTRKNLMGMMTMTLAWSKMAHRSPEHMFMMQGAKLRRHTPQNPRASPGPSCSSSS